MYEEYYHRAPKSKEFDTIRESLGTLHKVSNDKF